MKMNKPLFIFRDCLAVNINMKKTFYGFPSESHIVQNSFYLYLMVYFKVY